MAHPYDKYRQAEHGKERAKAFTSKYDSGGKVPFYETKSGPKGSIEAKGVQTYRNELGREGGRFGGKQGIRRLLEDEVSGSDKPMYAKGGRTKGKKASVNVNIISAPGGGKDVPPPVPPLGLGGPRPVPPMLAPGAAPPPGLPPPGMKPPGVMKRGGVVKRLAGGKVKMTGGAEGGLGRLQMAKAAKIRRGG